MANITNTSATSINILSSTFKVRFESWGHLIRSIKVKIRPFPCEMTPVMCVLGKW